ncbi:YuzL family protein (plasmid) [Cytobacillus spongiae]|nr:YuzL family protein [Cytobacillus spongiae]NMH70241.1 YuzL family protein [Bacillus sp. RO3]UII58513.1 YuzL family protein [Cytobacillus spongiae]
MSKKKKDPSKAVLGSSQVEGQGVTNRELPGGVKVESSRSRTKK